MSDEKKYTEREMVLRNRHAFMNGASWELCRRFDGKSASTAATEREAEQRYPMRVTQHRVVTFGPGTYWKLRVMNGEVQCRGGSEEEWKAASGVDFIVNREFIDICADLLANPTEEVDE